MNPRNDLLENMQKLSSEGMGCDNCQGHCCTYQANSMQITPLEAFEMLESLGGLSGDLTKRLEDNISEFRLDKEIFISKNKTMRRTYTCPFFNNGPLGCSIKPEAKPYGCLAFNANEKAVSEFGKCSSKEELLREVDERVKAVNMAFKERYKISWSKKPIPMALLELNHNISQLES